MNAGSVSLSRFILWLEREFDKTLASYMRVRTFLALLSRGKSWLRSENTSVLVPYFSDSNQSNRSGLCLWSVLFKLT
jgi:hypothetical protein